MGAADSVRDGKLAREIILRDAQAYPVRPVRIIVPFPPGSSDAVARMIAIRLGERFGQQFVIDNRPGAAATLGTNIAAKAGADGYTMLFPTCAFAISAAIYKSLPYNSERDFDPVALVSYSPMVLVAHPGLAANSIKELIALAKAKPGALNYASNGSGSITFLGTELLKGMASINLTEISYKGAGPSVTALMAGEVQVMIAPLGATLPYVRAGRLKAIAMASERRALLLPELLTVAEAGVPGFDATCWYGVLAPHGTPPVIVNTLNEQIVAAMKNTEMRDQLVTMGYEPTSSSPQQFGIYLRAEIAKWTKTVRDSGAKPE